MPLWERQAEQWLAEKPERTAAADFDAFWDQTQSLALSQPLNPEIVSVDYPTKKISAYQVSFDAFDRGRIQAWLLVPTNSTSSKLPALIRWHDYLGFRGRICTHLTWALQGFVVLVPDIRGHGDSSDLTHYSRGNNKGYFAQGILDPQEYYLRGCIADGLRAVQFLNGCEEVDPDRVGMIGDGLGGLITLWTAAFDSQISTIAPVSPYPCNWERHVVNGTSVASDEVKIYLTRYSEQEEAVWNTLNYFDPINVAHRVGCPSFFPLGLQGNTAPPQDSVGIYNLIEGEKELKVLPYDGHSAGIEELICWMQERLQP